MTDTPVLAATPWPLAPGEHPTLPELVLELQPGTPGSGTDRKPIPPRPPVARILFSPVRVVETSNPGRIRSYADGLLDLADALEAAHRDHTAGQLDLGPGA